MTSAVTIKVLILQLLLFTFFLIILPLVLNPDYLHSFHYQGQPISQLGTDPYKLSLTTSRLHLNSLSFLLKNPGLQSHQAFTITINDYQNNILRQASFSGFNVGDPGWITYKFLPLDLPPDSSLTAVISPSQPSQPPLQIYLDPDNKQLVYRSTSTPSNLLDRLSASFSRLKQLQPTGVIAYFFVLFLLNLFLILL